MSKIIRSIPAYRQVEDYIRSQIADGTWPKGTRLPLSPAIAAHLGVSVFPVQTALARLCREGLLDRRPRAGTHVRGGSVRLTCAGLYFSQNILLDPDEAFNRALCGELQRQWTDRGTRTVLWVDTRPFAKQAAPFAPLVRAIEKGTVQAVLGTGNGNTVPWLSQLKVPAILGTGLKMPNRLGTDWHSLMRASFERLHALGCRSAGLIVAHPIRSHTPVANDDMDFYDAFFDSARRFGLATHNAWIRTPAIDEWPRHREEYGYRQFRELWSQAERPDGLVVYPDIAVRGVLAAVAALRVRVPDDLKLVLHANDQAPYVCPVPATQLMTRVGECAKAVIEAIEAQIQGLPPSPVMISHSVQEVESPRVPPAA